RQVLDALLGERVHQLIECSVDAIVFFFNEETLAPSPARKRYAQHFSRFGLRQVGDVFGEMGQMIHSREKRVYRKIGAERSGHLPQASGETSCRNRKRISARRKSFAVEAHKHSARGELSLSKCGLDLAGTRFLQHASPTRGIGCN